MGVFNDIQNALNIKLNSLSGIPLIYFPNDQKEPTQGVSYIRPFIIPATSQLYTLNGSNYHSGIYQVDIFTPLKKGTSQAWLIADLIKDGFNKQSLTQNSNILHIQNISIGIGEREESWWHCYVEVNYLCV